MQSLGKILPYHINLKMNRSTYLSEAMQKILKARRLRALGKQDEALEILREFRRKLFRRNADRSTKTAIDHEIVNASCERVTKLYDQGKFREGYSTSLYDLECLGDDCDEECKLALMNNAALNLLEMGEQSQSYEMYKEVHLRQIKLFGPHHFKTLTTQSNLAQALGELGKYEDSLKLYKYVLEKLEGDGEHVTITHMNMAIVMLKAGAPKDALEQFQIVLGKTIRAFGQNHRNTLSVQHNLAKALLQLKRFPEALEVFTHVFNRRMEKLGPNHLLTLDSQAYIGRVIFEQGEYLEALRTYKLVSDKFKAALGDGHPETRSISEAIEVLKRRVGSEKFTELQAMCGKRISLERLHNLIKCGDKDGVNDLLADGIVDITQVTAQKGNTPLHMAVNKNNMDIVESLLEYAKKKLTPSEMVKFIDAKTTSAVGNTAMHIAASNGLLKPMKALLRYGATYNIKNKKGKTPIDQTNEPKIKSFLGLTNEIFEASKRGDPEVISKLKALDNDELLAVVNAKTDQGYSIQQVLKTKSLLVEFSKLSV